ncbi:cysteine--tRNA ligase [Lactobacillus sp. YT155]|uniref:cysteine--tRNA ligase n=1 Tax=Lactobacillus sp. YT155 TaxID=3060955 RepID=UPI00265EB627|nr:cysteine--tRNA ligase [Lactobacillus sp. YT155]MDO1604456.1 cysteine--tRNA ligase [Lactobacillus sp. YT155]
MKIYNTMTNQIERFVPKVANQVSMYVCGPTVYNYIHIGNARSVVAFDTIRRYFEYRGYQVNYISNFTDVDDKMIKQAKADGITVPELADKYIAAFMEDTQALNVQPATKNPRATQYIPKIIDFIADLIAKDYAYEVNGDVYYRARKFANYGELSGQNIDDLEEGASQHVTSSELKIKEDPIDFALWKAAKPEEISWDSPWGKGRPGWHIECSVMSTDLLGDNFDIHGGGQDLEFPHHENEIAQSEAKTGQKFANYWMHNGFVTVGADAEKMSKSLGNFITVHELIKTVNPQVIRFFMATTHYRRPLQYTDENIEDAKTNLNRIKTSFNNLNYRLQNDTNDSSENPELKTSVGDIKSAFVESMDDDFNVQNGITAIYDLVKIINNYLEENKVAVGDLEFLKETLLDLTGVFGIELTEASDVDAQIKEMITARDAARANKNFAESDRIRDELKAQGIILEDTPNGTRYHKEEN